MTESVEVAQARLAAAQHAMQTGVAMKIQTEITAGAIQPGETSPKHLRVGVNAAMVGHGALMALLFKKGVITEQEYFTELADAMEREKQAYEVFLSQHLGRKVVLH